MGKECKACGKKISGISDICRECAERMFAGTPLAELIRKADKVEMQLCTESEASPPKR